MRIVAPHFTCGEMGYLAVHFALTRFGSGATPSS